MFSRRSRLSLVIGCTLLGAVSNPTPGRAATAPRAKSVEAASFALAIDGHEVGVFTQLVSVAASVDPNGKASTKKATVVLRRPLTRNLEMAAWHELAAQGAASAKKNVALAGRSTDGTVVMRFNLTKAFPIKVEVTGSATSSVLMETVTLTCDSLVRVGV